MVDVTQLVESRIVIPVVAGSSPVVHPKECRLGFAFQAQQTPSKGAKKRNVLFGPLAQLVEQMTLNHRVVGSIPTRPTK